MAGETNTLPTLATIAKFSPLVRTELIDEAVRLCPEMTNLPWKTVPGYTYQTLVRTANPTVHFRAVNTGTDSVGSTYDNRTITCAALNPQIVSDKMAADACVDGSDYFLAAEAKATLQAAFLANSKQMWYGTSNDALGYVGLQSQVDATMLINAGGSTATTGSSVYVIAAGQPDYLTLVLGGNGDFSISEVRKESRLDNTDANKSKHFTCYVQDVEAWTGVQLGNKYAICRICNITNDTNKGLTDNLLSQAYEKFDDIGLEPTAIFMTARSRGQLQRSRTATNPTGAEAEYPTNYQGVPILTSRALNNTEAIVSFAS